jgi:hypothetical protein
MNLLKLASLEPQPLKQLSHLDDRGIFGIFHLDYDTESTDRKVVILF